MAEPTTTNPGSWKRPVIVLVPGAWHIPEHYAPTTSLLQKAGYDVHALRMPSTIQTRHPDHNPDIALIASTIQKAADAGEDVIVVMHSAGGVTGGSATKGLTKADREQNGLSGGVVRAVYICSFCADEGMSVFKATNGPDEWIAVDGEVCNPTQMEQIFYNDLSPEVQQDAISKLTAFPTGTLWSEATYAPWKHIPSSYLICEQDNAIPLAAQEALSSQDGAKFDHIERCTASHSPFLSMPEFTAAFVRRAAGEKVD